MELQEIGWKAKDLGLLLALLFIDAAEMRPASLGLHCRFRPPSMIWRGERRSRAMTGVEWRSAAAAEEEAQGPPGIYACLAAERSVPQSSSPSNRAWHAEQSRDKAAEEAARSTTATAAITGG